MATDFPPLPPVEARVRALESLTSILHARIEQLAADISASFKDLALYNVQESAHTETLFQQAEKSREEMERRLNAHLDVMEKRIQQQLANIALMIEERLPKK